LIRENYTAHTVEADMIKDSGMAYREIGGRDRTIFCPVCSEYGRGVAADSVFYNNKRLKKLRFSIRRHLATDAHQNALAEKEKGRTRNLRRIRIRLSITRTTMQGVREGNRYLLFKERLQSIHLAGLNIGSLNHSRQIITSFVGSMLVVMVQRILRHLHEVYAVAGRKRLFALMADKVTELHTIGDAIAVMVMSEVGELQAIFVTIFWSKGLRKL
jgi:hypothetical protein